MLYIYLCVEITFIFTSILSPPRLFVCRFYADTSRDYVELGKNATSKSSANFLRSQNEVHSEDHMIIGNGQYFVLDADAVNREESSQQRSMLN